MSYEVSAKRVIYSMSRDNEPALRVPDGAEVVFHTRDCFGNQLQSEDSFCGSLDRNHMNPATGPVYIEGAEPGNTLLVRILSIRVGGTGTMSLIPGEGLVGIAMHEEHTKRIPIRGDRADFGDGLMFPLRPMIGVIGTAPDGDPVSTDTPGPHGGNMDCNHICRGSSLYLPVSVPGALLAVGNVHALMGDGVASVCGVEIPADITVKVRVLKNCALPLPFLVADTAAMTVASAPTLDDAAQMAALNMLDFLENELGLSEKMAANLTSVGCELRICQAAAPQKTCRMELRREITDHYWYHFPIAD